MLFVIVLAVVFAGIVLVRFGARSNRKAALAALPPAEQARIKSEKQAADYARYQTRREAKKGRRKARRRNLAAGAAVGTVVGVVRKP